MKVLHLSAADVYGGGEEHIRTLLAALVAQKKKEEEVLLACPGEAPLAKKCESQGITVIPFSFGGKKDPLAPIRLRKLIKELGCDIVHSHNRREDLAAILGHGSAQVWTTLHDRINMTQAGERSTTFFDRVYVKILPRFDKILTVSAATLDDYQRLSGDTRSGNCSITNGMDLNRLADVARDDGFRSTYGIGQDKVIILLSARIRGGSFGKKGHLRLLDVLKEVSGSYHLVTVGEDESSSKILQKEAAKRTVPITTLGFQENVLPVMQQADVVVLPSLFEGLPRALMEAMALGRAVIGSDVDGIRALTDEGRVGRLVGVHDTSAWVKAIEELIADKILREEMGKQAASHIKEHFSSECMAREHWELYREASS